MGAHIGIEPVWNTLITGGGAGQVEKVSLGQVAQNASGNLGPAYNSSLLNPLDGFLVSDILPLDIPVGGAIGIRMSFGYKTPYVSRVALSSGTSSAAPAAAYEAAFAASTFTDYSISGSIGTNSGSAYLLQPLLVLGLPKTSGITVMARGDSRCSGQSSGLGITFGNIDVLDKDGNVGWFEKACSLSAGLLGSPYSNFSSPSNAIYPLVQAPYFSRTGFLKSVAMARPTAVYLGLNFNDMGAGVSLSTILSYEQQLINEVRGLGVKYVFTDTTDPYTNSSDSYATLSNQTYANTFVTTSLLGRNTQLRAGTWGTYDFFIDQSANVESSVNSGYWKTNGTANYYTGDGTHASPQAIGLKAATAAAVMAANISL